MEGSSPSATLFAWIFPDPSQFARLPSTHGVVTFPSRGLEYRRRDFGDGTEAPVQSPPGARRGQHKAMATTRLRLRRCSTRRP